MEIHLIPLTRNNIDLMTVHETGMICFAIVSQSFEYLQQFLEKVPCSEKSFVKNCHDCILTNLELFFKANYEYSRETHKPIKIHEIMCTIMNQGESVSLITMQMNPLRLETVEPFAVTKVLAATIDIIVRSISRRIPFSIYVQIIENCIQIINHMVDNVHSLISRNFNDSEFIVNATTNLPSIMLKIGKEKQKYTAPDSTLRMLNF